jgi:hypothetical protein
MSIDLGSPVAANAVLVKGIDQENLMAQWGDDHNWPNIDIAHVLFSGKLLELPPGTVLKGNE